MARILIIEDEKILNAAYRLILEKEGHAVTTAHDGLAGLKLARSFKPDIILLDLLMPVMDGVEFLKAYQPKQKHPHCHIIILSNIDQDTNIQKAYKLGASRYVLKAVTSPQQLAVLVNHIVKK
ncbi:MAG: hypothetical protein QG553_192 [Patescibacteria group bacterium]|nr:hypothetical protein [Patescibacteria group bacterium]